MPNLVLNQSWD